MSDCKEIWLAYRTQEFSEGSPVVYTLLIPPTTGRPSTQSQAIQHAKKLFKDAAAQACAVMKVADIDVNKPSFPTEGVGFRVFLILQLFENPSLVSSLPTEVQAFFLKDLQKLANPEEPTASQIPQDKQGTIRALLDSHRDLLEPQQEPT